MTPRWFDGPNHVGRIKFWRSNSRFIFCHSGRRSWKTETAKRRMVRSLITTTNKKFLAGAPTNKQAKKIFWEDFKRLIPKKLAPQRYDGELFIRTLAGSELHVAGMDSPDRVEGQMWDGVLLDEYGNMAERVWPEVISPVLSDTRGWAMLTGVPEGRNHYYDLIQRMRHRENVDVFHWPSWEILPPEEIEVQRENLDELTFNQEFGGEFVHFAGRAYYAFDAVKNCGPVRGLYNSKAPLVFCFDFNVDPGVAVVCQEAKLPNGQVGTAVISEVYIPRNSNTEIVCNKLGADWKGHEGFIRLYGDFTGGARGTAKLKGSDWEIIHRTLSQHFNPGRIQNFVSPNPPVKSRVNAVNARMRSANGVIRCIIDPETAPHLAKDLEGVTWLSGASGELDKSAKSKDLTHISDAFGYYIAREFPIKTQAAARIGNLH